MTKTYSQIVQQIETLKQQADAIRKQEVSEVIGRIKDAIAFYQLTADDLGLSGHAAARPSGKSTKSAAAPGPQFRDGSGNSWSGRGPRPRWLKAALAAGKSLDDFRTSGSGAAGGAAEPALAAPRKAKAGKKKAALAVKYRDDAGNSWSGRGPKPGWLKAGLAAGKRIEDFTG